MERGASEERARGPDRPPMAVALLRAASLRCPGCGGRGMVRRWVGVRAVCPGCGLRTDRGEHDHFLGAMALNLVVAELTLVVVLAGAMMATWPDPPWRLLTWGGAALALVLPAAFYPFTKLSWLALDLRFRPEEDGEGSGRPGPGDVPSPPGT